MVLKLTFWAISAYMNSRIGITPSTAVVTSVLSTMSQKPSAPKFWSLALDALAVVYLGINLTHPVRHVFYVWAEPLLSLNAWFVLIKHRTVKVSTTRHCAKLGLFSGYRDIYLCSAQLPKSRKKFGSVFSRLCNIGKLVSNL
jgi:hypothetical protein